MTPEDRRTRMAQAGIPMPISGGAVNGTPVTSSNADMHARFQAIKNGAKKNVFQQLATAAPKNQPDFKPIPESRNSKERVSPGKSVQLANFDAPPSGELSAIEAMYGGSPSIGAYSPQVQNNSSQSDLNTNSYDYNYGPSFDPHAALTKRRMQLQQENEYLKYAMQPEQQAINMQEQPMPNTQINQFNFEMMQKMMQEIAKNTISEVLSSYTETQKNRNTYELLAKETADGCKVIKTQDGQYYKLIPVKVTNKAK